MKKGKEFSWNGELISKSQELISKSQSTAPRQQVDSKFLVGNAESEGKLRAEESARLQREAGITTPEWHGEYK